jgi:hypothetical protein
MASQCERLLDYLQSNDGIDPLTAWRDLGIYRLGARVFDLRKEGLPIARVMKAVTNRWGETAHVAYYKLEQEQ